MSWSTFNVGRDATVDFLYGGTQPTLNRILDPNPSQIMGRITASEQVLLVNPNGLTFGSTAATNVRGLVVSTLDTMGPDSFARYTLREGTVPAVVANRDGTIVSTLGSANLIGSAVLNNGSVFAVQGRINLTVGGPWPSGWRCCPKPRSCASTAPPSSTCSMCAT